LILPIITAFPRLADGLPEAHACHIFALTILVEGQAEYRERARLDGGVPFTVARSGEIAFSAPSLPIAPRVYQAGG
jgi:hypothetical protein